MRLIMGGGEDPRPFKSKNCSTPTSLIDWMCAYMDVWRAVCGMYSRDVATTSSSVFRENRTHGRLVSDFRLRIVKKAHHRWNLLRL